MKIGEMRERIALCRIKSPQSAYQIFNPALSDIAPFAEVWAKREDKATVSRWGMVTTRAIERKQFIIRYRADLPAEMALVWNGEVFTVFGASDLANTKHWTMLLVGRIGINEDGY